MPGVEMQKESGPIMHNMQGLGSRLKVLNVSSSRSQRPCPQWRCKKILEFVWVNACAFCFPRLPSLGCGDSFDDCVGSFPSKSLHRERGLLEHKHSC